MWQDVLTKIEKAEAKELKERGVTVAPQTLAPTLTLTPTPTLTLTLTLALTLTLTLGRGWAGHADAAEDCPQPQP